MLGGLARWLRAAGYDASFENEIEDGELIRRAAAEDRVVLSSDGGIFERNLVKSGSIRALFVPRGMRPADQLRLVRDALGLWSRPARCMTCSGELVEVTKASIVSEAPPRSFEAYSRFWRCSACSKLFWRGTHWERIA